MRYYQSRVTTAAEVGPFWFMSLVSERDFENNNLLDTCRIYIFCYQASVKELPLTVTPATAVTLNAHPVSLNTNNKP